MSNIALYLHRILPNNNLLIKLTIKMKYIKRNIYAKLAEWKNNPDRRPLLVKGARQVGKSYIINEFGKKEFKRIVTLNFEKNPEYKDIFVTYNIAEILEKISLFTGVKLEAGKTLLFLDEIQECPRAITSLRYFFEEYNLLHVVGAGSLLEFTLESEQFHMRVGRIQYLYMFPVSFGEFLDAIGENTLHAYILDISRLSKLPETLHIKLSEYVRKYFIIGGMPAVVQAYCTRHDIINCQRIQRSIIDTYIDDFGKYSRKLKHKYLQKVFNSVPTMVGRKLVYSHIDNTAKSRDLKEAVELLEMAGITHRVKRTSGAGLPFEASIKENFFKELFLDIGLLHTISGIHSETAQAKDFTAIFKGSVAEQFVGQELIAYADAYTKPSLYYWSREAKNSNAEVDYLISKNNLIIPIEIKSGVTGKMKSLRMFIDNYKIDYGIKISQANYNARLPIISLPFYALESFFYQT